MIIEENKNLNDMNSPLIKNSEIKNQNIIEVNKSEANMEDFSKTKINKPYELREFDAMSHFNENIINYNKNCKNIITESSYYCFTCKHSVCEECGVLDHKDHLLIQRESCINYDTTFFNEISKVIDDSFLIQNKKEIFKNNIIASIEELQKELDNLKNEKIKEIDIVFEEIEKNLKTLKNNFCEAKLSIEDYYNRNKLFFNITTIHSNSSDIKKEHEEKMNDKIETNSNLYEDDDKIIQNIDLENTIFLMNFELMNLCDNKNLQVLDSINKMKYDIDFLINNIQQKSNNILKEIKNNFNIKQYLVKFDDYYLDVKIRTKKYNEFINNFKSLLSKLITRNGNLDKLKDFVGIYDSKYKKGKDKFYNQYYFKNYYNMNFTQNKNNNYSPKRNSLNSNNSFKKPKNMRSSPKVLMNDKLNRSLKQNKRFLTYNNNLFVNKNDNCRVKRKQSYITNYKSINSSYKNSKNNKSKESFKKNKLTNSFIKINSLSLENYDNIILNQRIIQRFFAYSILKVFSKFFNNEFNNNYKFEKNSVNFLSNYTRRFNKLKEIAKPIIGTNLIYYFDSNTNQIFKIPINLSKIEHGYTVFPFGCRHILINNILYIIGGADNVGNPINIVLSYDLIKNILEKLPNLNDEHAYHTVEYLENFDSIILIGGEKSSSCEIMDLDNRQWKRLPYLNYPRANVNIYYNSITYELYALFGMEGEITAKNKNSDIIEILKLNDILSGWKKIDYYRSSGLNIKSNFCMTLPFTRDKLLIYGCSDARFVDKKLFALFNMNKNECIKVDKDVLDFIKLEEKRIEFFDFELSKIE